MKGDINASEFLQVSDWKKKKRDSSLFISSSFLFTYVCLTLVFFSDYSEPDIDPNSTFTNFTFIFFQIILQIL